MIVVVDDWALVDFIEAFYSGEVVNESGDSWIVGTGYEDDGGIAQHFIKADAESSDEGFRVTFRRAKFQ